MGLGQRVEQEVGEVAAEHLLETRARRYRQRLRVTFRRRLGS